MIVRKTTVLPCCLLVLSIQTFDFVLRAALGGTEATVRRHAGEVFLPILDDVQTSRSRILYDIYGRFLPDLVAFETWLRVVSSAYL